MKLILNITLVAVASLSTLPVWAGKQAATLGGSGSAVGNSFAPPLTSINSGSPAPAVITTSNSNTPAVLSNIAAPGQGAFTVLAPGAGPALAVVFGSSSASPAVAAAVSAFNSNVQSALPQLNNVQVMIPQSSTPVSLGQAVQSTMLNPTPASILSTVQLTVAALTQNPNNVALQQFAVQLVNTFNTIAANANTVR